MRDIKEYGVDTKANFKANVESLIDLVHEVGDWTVDELENIRQYDSKLHMMVCNWLSMGDAIHKHVVSRMDHATVNAGP